MHGHGGNIDALDGGSTDDTRPSSDPTLYLLISATTTITESEVIGILSREGLLGCPAESSLLRTVQVPRQPPISEVQAKEWSQKYWPTVYRGGNPFGPHPSLVSRTELELRPNASVCMSLAKEAAVQAKSGSYGEAIGVVIVDPTAFESPPSPVSVAGDARWSGPDQGDSLANCNGNGNVMGHAVMRAIGMVARLRLAQAEQSSAGGQRIPTANDFPGPSQSTFLDWPLTPLERDVFAKSSLGPHGYLCLGLDMYMTHEPCIMCSMALLHSRFRNVVFCRRMPLTGGLTAEQGVVVQTSSSPGAMMMGEKSSTTAREIEEASVDEDNGAVADDDGGLGYGLFWRNELNWKFLAWEWRDENSDAVVERGLHA